MESQILQDAQATLELEKVARMKSEQRRLLENDVMAVRLKVEEMVRKQAKLKLAAASLEQHRVFLNDIISHKVSPRTPSSARRFFDSEGGVAEMVHSPKMIRERLAKKEMNVISQSELMLQATELVDRFPVNHRSNANNSLIQLSQPLPARPEPKIHFTLNDEVFSVVHRLYKRFISTKSCNYEPLGSFAAIEHCAYHLLDLVASCDPTMLDKIISKIVMDKKKSMETKLLEEEEAKRRKREEIALLRATSAPAEFKRPAVTRKQFSSRKISLSVKEEIVMRHREDLSYLFKLQQD